MAEVESFRDRISTVDKEGKRVWIYPKKVKGKFMRYRSWVSYTLLALLLSGPFLRINGEPLLMLNVIERQFVLFGQIFWPEDFHIFLIGTLCFMLFIVLFTVIYGRLFCGWICPQTIFMEFVFRKVEYWIEGDWRDQQALDRAPWSAGKWMKKGSKHLIFIVLSVFISNILLMYIIGSDGVLSIISDNPSEHLGGLIAMIVFSGAFYFVYSKFREQVCTTVCPYGRLQGVMMDRNSIVVAYDYVRGESRAKIRKGEDRKLAQKGDCIDCHHCVDVCPTGIDIRNGVQLECINCTLCIDACDAMMKQVNLPAGLIRYSSEEGIANSRPFTWTKRILGYTAVLAVLLGVFVLLLITRTDVETILVRTPGMLFQEVDSNRVQNVYSYKLINKTKRDIPFEFRLIDRRGEIKPVGKLPLLKSKSLAEGSLFILLDKGEIHSMNTKLRIGVFENNVMVEDFNISFVGPIQ
ncbi:MAG: cytochrome c oxidase accessory protein CcoG [Cytophagaceae bacterium]|jgi:cytochrome c oxidase accessory protein FixG|nr:cytochrome c oxidase accessory protein CcoG [Cytophagaceae bacterium]